MLMNRCFKIVFISGFCILLMACGGSGQDTGTPANISNDISGRVIDGFLARATVFVDTNNNGTRDAWEAFAFTDNEGYYSYNPNTDTDYCASGADASLSQYCLNIQTDIANFVIRIDSGYDVLTGEPFFGQMSRRVNLDESQDTSFIVSPLTTLVTSIDNEQSQLTVLNSLGLSASDLDVDYLSDSEFNPELLATAVRIHKAVSIISDRLTDVYDDIGSTLGTPNDATATVYRQLATQLAVGVSTIDEVLADSDQLIAIMNESEGELRSLYTLRELTLPTDIGSVSEPSGFTRAVNIASQVSDIVDSVLAGGGTSEADVIGQVRVIESVVIKSLAETDNSDSTIDNAIEFLTNADNTDLVASLTDALSQKDAFVSELAGNDFTGDDFNTAADFDAAVSLPSGAEPFSLISGKMVRLYDPDLGDAPNNLKDIEVVFFFEGATDATSGSFSACAKYIDGASSSGDLGEGNTRGELIDGFWSLLDAENNESYSILMTATFLGATYQSIIKPAVYVQVGDAEKYALRFDFNGNIRDWYTENGFEDSSTVPTTSAACESLLPSRIGI